MPRAAVLGRPIAHSLSPVLHRAAYGALGLTDWTYEAVECDQASLPSFLASRSTEWVGFSCTMPLKRAVVAVASEVSDRARAVGAGNTLLRRADGWFAENTDVDGIVGALRERGVAPERPLILGAGGTAQGAVVALAELGLRTVTVAVRNVERTGEVRGTGTHVGVDVVVQHIDDVQPRGFDLVVSTLPAGAGDQIAALEWAGKTMLLDAVYAPWPSSLAVAVRAAGGEVISGALMLLHQAVGQVALMTGREPPLAAMREALDQALPQAGVVNG